MKTILVLTGGGATDAPVFDTALAVARPLRAHLEFLHIRLSSGEAAQFIPHVGFARGPALGSVMDMLRIDDATRAVSAAEHFARFCGQEGIVILDTPAPCEDVSARWREEQDDAVRRILTSARHNDLVVVARPSGANGLPFDLVERLLFGCGRPILIAPRRVRPNLGGTALVCWKETDTSARALGAALPFLSKCKRVILATVEEGDGTSHDEMTDLAQRLAWHGINPEIDWIPADVGPTAERLEDAAARHEADILVMGAYGHSRMREMIFGGCTQHFLERADRPIFIMR